MSKQTALLGIMEADAFKNRTKATAAVGGFMSKFKSRGGGMAGVDMALEAWSRDCDDDAVSPQQKLVMVRQIAMACDAWFKQKSDLGKSTELSEARSRVIAEVRRATTTAQQYLKTKADTGSTRRAVKGLGKGYAHERTDYVARNKQENPFSGSAVERHSHGNFTTMSYEDFATAAGGLDGGSNRVEFLNREQRLKYLVTIMDGKMYQDGELLDQLQTIKNGNKRLKTWMYAVDRYGNLYARSPPDSGFNHSSFCAGKAIICAGTLGCVEGQLRYVSNLSGHYRPNAAFLGQFLRILAEEGVDLDDTLAFAMDRGAWLKAMTMLRSPSAATDWPHMNGQYGDVMVRGQAVMVADPG